MFKKRFIILSLIIIAFTSYCKVYANDIPQLPIGMNVSPYNYYSSQLVFNNVMKSSSSWITFNASGSSPWDTKKGHELELDKQRYPLEIPAFVQDGSHQAVRFLINNHYKGRFRFLYDGEGQFRFRVPTVKENGQIFILLDGKGGHKWIEILRSERGNHIRNIRIIPEEQPKDFDRDSFYPLFLKGLEPFHCLRFIDWIKTTGSTQTTWDNRAKAEFYSQGMKQGIAIEYAIKLCNLLKCDAWFCVPYNADDDYIYRFAVLARDTLDPSLKVYIEYSNEVWNWLFPQTHYVLHNAPGAHDQYVIDALNSINPEPKDHPEKDAFMMQRVFRIWKDVFGEQQGDRLVRVAAVQHSWVENTPRILTYLFKRNQFGKSLSGGKYKTSTGQGCDAVSPTGYLNFTKEDHERWNSMDPNKVTPEMILEAVEEEYERKTSKRTEENAKYARAWNVDYVVYEGGQHIQPYKQKEWDYNHAIWDAQIHPRIYDIYMKLFRKQTSKEVDCKLFCAFNYVSRRQTQWGSWGHIESLYQLINFENIRTVAPKYTALLDVNTQK